jgi:hypothetical protein
MIWYDMDRIENTAYNGSSSAACVFFAEGKRLPSCCLSTAVSSGSTISACGGDTQTRRQQRDFINLLLLFQNKESKLKITNLENPVCSVHRLYLFKERSSRKLFPRVPVTQISLSSLGF